ncbi:MAG TPA: hypothetical protein VGL72_30570 [Bryobacteraceae bacterium]|jgi:hypothetical protein
MLMMKWLLIAAACSPAAVAAEPETTPPHDQVTITKTDRIDFAPGGTIRVGVPKGSSHGDLNIIAWDKPEVEITVIKSTKRLYTPQELDQARKHLDLIGVKMDSKSPTELAITTSLPPRTLRRLNRGTSDLLLEYQIHVPKNVNLAVHHGTGTVLIAGVTGDIDARVSKGDIMVLVPSADGYSIDARSKLGGVESDFGGPSRTHHFAAHQLGFAPASLKHKLYLRVGIGSINIKEDKADAK